MMKWINHSPYKPGLAGSIPDFSVCLIRLLAMVPSINGLSCWWDVLVVGGMLNTSKLTNNICFMRILIK